MPKSMNYAILEAIQGEMRRDRLLTLLYESQQTAARWRGESVDLEAEFGPPRVQFRPIDPRTLAPLERVMETIVKSVKKTGSLLASDEALLHPVWRAWSRSCSPSAAGMCGRIDANSVGTWNCLGLDTSAIAPPQLAEWPPVNA